jgi:hypothetical protein
MCFNTLSYISEFNFRHYDKKMRMETIAALLHLLIIRLRIEIVFSAQPQNFFLVLGVSMLDTYQSICSKHMPGNITHQPTVIPRKNWLQMTIVDESRSALKFSIFNNHISSGSQLHKKGCPHYFLKTKGVNIILT